MNIFFLTLILAIFTVAWGEDMAKKLKDELEDRQAMAFAKSL